MSSEAFTGDKKVDQSWLIRTENNVVARTIHYLPSWLETYHLTLMTIVWSMGVVISGYLARQNLSWLWLSSLMIFMQYVTDLYDGKVGKHRNTGLIKWGYFMDHFLDYIFLCSILTGYFFLIPLQYHLYLFAIMAFSGAFMVNSYLSFAATNRFKIEFLTVGPTQVRFGFIVFNTLIICFGTPLLIKSLPFFLVTSFVVLCLVVYRTQKYIWKMDMENKKK
ncbi:MAG: hypothetical protein JSV71_05000 [Nitrospiraceae bacterium]|nr:MAG: hypothetical protein JSV71_05000 [Nitrospiraceae bacterium]